MGVFSFFKSTWPRARVVEIGGKFYPQRRRGGDWVWVDRGQYEWHQPSSGIEYAKCDTLEEAKARLIFKEVWRSDG